MQLQTSQQPQHTQPKRILRPVADLTFKDPQGRDRQVYEDQQGERGYIKAGTSEFIRCGARMQLRAFGSVLSVSIVRTERKPTGHQPPKVKKNGGSKKDKKNGKKKP